MWVHPSHQKPFITPFPLQLPVFQSPRAWLPAEEAVWTPKGDWESQAHISASFRDTSTVPLSHQPGSVHSCCFFGDWEKREGLERKTKNLDCPQPNQCQLLMMLVMLGLWKPFMKHVKLTFKANKPHCHQFKVSAAPCPVLQGFLFPAS